MARITAHSLLPLEDYARARPDFRARVRAHKQDRVLRLGGHLSLHFEDELTMRYQVQEMLRAEGIRDAAGIQAELDAYNPLVPDGANLKATLMIEYPDPDERRAALARLRGVEARVWLRVAGHPAVHAVADEDLARADADKTAAVHFLRFELGPERAAALKAGAALAAGVDHPACPVSLDPVPGPVRAALAKDMA